MASEAETLVIRIKLLGQREFAAGTAAARAELSSVAKESAVANRSLKKTSFNAGLMGAGFHRMARGAHAVGLALVGAAVGSAVAGVHFEQEMARLGSVVHLTGDQYKTMSQLALVESTKTRFSATQAAEAMYLLGRSGFNANQIMAALPGTLALAHASGIDLAAAARIQTEALRGFNLEASQTGRVADVMARATRGGNLSMADLAYTIKYVGASSFATGQKMEDVVGLVEALARHGIRGTQAGTTLRSMMTRLVDPAKKVKDGLALMNMQARELYGPKGLLPMPKILDTMRKKLMALDPVSRERAIHQVFGQWAFQGASAILNTDPTIVNKFIRDLNNAKGTAKSMADILNNTVQMQLLRMWHTLESIGIGIYMTFRVPLKNALKDVNNWLTPFVKQIQILGMFMQQGDWAFLVTYLDNMTHSGGNLSKAIFFLWDALQVTWTFIRNVVLPVAKQWGIILGVAVYGALKLLVGIMRLANHHARIAKFVIGLLILAYIHWKVYTLIVVGVQKAMAFWTAVNIARERVLMVVRGLATAATWLYANAWLYLSLAMEANPIGMIIVGLVLLGVALYLAYKHVKWFHNLVDGVFNWIKDHWRLLAVILFGPFGAAVVLIIDHWHTLVSFFTNFPDRMTGIASGMWDWLKQGFIDVLNWIIKKWNSIAGKFAFSTPNFPGTNTGGIDYGGLPRIGLIGGDTTAAPGAGTAASAAGRTNNFFPPKVLDPKSPSDPSKNPLINPTITVITHLDGKEIARSTNKHNAHKKARH